MEKKYNLMLMKNITNHYVMATLIKWILVMGNHNGLVV